MTEFSRFLSFYKDAIDLNLEAKNQQGSSRGFQKRDEQIVFSRFMIDVGSYDQLGPKSLISLINKDPELRRAQIGKIEIDKNVSYFEIEQSYEKKVLDAFKNNRLSRHHIDIKLVK